MPKKPNEADMKSLIDNILPITDAELLVSKCELDPETKITLQIHLFKNVKNMEEIRKNIMNGSWKCVIIKPALILDLLQIFMAANKAVLSEKHNTMATRTVYTEILYNLSLTKNISQSLSKFGIEKDTEMFVCFLTTPETDHTTHILSKIEGKACKMEYLLNLRDLSKIKNVYKFNGLKCDVNLREMLNIIISRMATKNIISY